MSIHILTTTYATCLLPQDQCCKIKTLKKHIFALDEEDHRNRSVSTVHKLIMYVEEPSVLGTRLILQTLLILSPKHISK